MKRLTLTTALIFTTLAAASAVCVLAYNCGDRWTHRGDTLTRNESQETLTKTSRWTIYWVDGYSRTEDVTEQGQYLPQGFGAHIDCYPQFDSPYWKVNGDGYAEWDQITRPGRYNTTTGRCEVTDEFHSNIHRHACPTGGGGGGGGGCTTAGFDGSCPAGTSPYEAGLCCSSVGESPDCESGGSGYGSLCASPVLVDTAGDGFALTAYAGGVAFDLDGDGTWGGLAWTEAASDDAWLALDRDGSGTIDSGRELFGNFTAQPPSDAPNGFLALAEFDKAAQGGNSDGVIDARDAVFTSLRLWRDTSHDGRSQPAELFTLPALDIARLHLDFKESKRADEHGNEFRYRAKADDARGAKAGRWAWDVFLRNSP